MKPLEIITCFCIVVFILALGVTAYSFPYHTNSATLVASAVSQDYTNFTFHLDGFNDERIVFAWDQAVSNATLRITPLNKSNTNTVTYTNGIVTGGTNYALTIARTNLPAAADYYAEILGHTSNSYLNGPCRVLGKGIISRHRSIFEH